jgi:hypothetical protein
MRSALTALSLTFSAALLAAALWLNGVAPQTGCQRPSSESVEALFAPCLARGGSWTGAPADNQIAGLPRVAPPPAENSGTVGQR